MPFKTIGLNDHIVRGVTKVGYSSPTPIQAKAIPLAIKGLDIIGCAQTGTGKTAAFVLPILHKLSEADNLKNSKKIQPQALVLTPTRELAVQIDKCIEQYGSHLNLRTLAVYGGINIHRQIKSLKRGVDIIVSTPGRLIDHLGRNTIDLRNINTLVVDEADRMFDMGFIKDVRKILAALPKKRQTMLFSATMSPEVKALAGDIMKSPEVIQIGKARNPVETVQQHVYPVEKQQKLELLLHLLENQSIYSALIFSRTKHGADKICRKLSVNGVNSVAIHSDRSQGQRQRALNGFKNGKYQVMVATDIAARGIDVEGLSHVINYDVPAYPEDYIHRIGRTGRAEATGDAITFVSSDEAGSLTKIEKFINRRLDAKTIDGFNYIQPPEQKRGIRKASGSAPRSSGGRRRKPTSRRRGVH
ncbi:MAG: DEAD/DEAH box helicase [Sedimentisphaeraceae bacterium JB056]